jgi:hypothetical protein
VSELGPDLGLHICLSGTRGSWPTFGWLLPKAEWVSGL